jgi:hypothetical protein
MSGELWEQDDHELMAAVGRVLQRDPPPGHVLLDARAAFAWRDLAARIALLEFDSAVDDDGLARVRASSTVRRLTFRHEGLTVALEIHEVEGRVVGRLAPVESMRIELRHRRGTITAPVDELGFFACEAVPRGAISLRCTPVGDDVAIDTEWVTV